MKRIENGHYVKVHYTGTYGDGEVFDSSRGCEPLEVHVGAREVIPGFENALVGMGVQEKKTIKLGPDEAYGERAQELEKSFSRADFPEEFQPEVGQVIVLQNPDEGQFPATVLSVDNESVVLDLNHPLAGESLTFDIEVIEINDEPQGRSCGSCCSCG